MMRSLLRVSGNWRVVAAWFWVLRAAGCLAGAAMGGGEDRIQTSLMSSVFSVSDMRSKSYIGCNGGFW